jgi:hypothetical protein
VKHYLKNKPSVVVYTYNTYPGDGGRTVVIQGWPKQQCQILSEKQTNSKGRGRGLSGRVLECETLSLIHSTTKKKEKKCKQTNKIMLLV